LQARTRANHRPIQDKIELYKAANLRCGAEIPIRNHGGLLRNPIKKCEGDAYGYASP
jgi:hypothetical protein